MKIQLTKLIPTFFLGADFSRLVFLKHNDSSQKQLCWSVDFGWAPWLKENNLVLTRRFNIE